MSLLLIWQKQVQISGSGGVAVDAPAVASTGTEKFTATGAVTIDAPAVSGSETETFTATGAITIDAPAVDGTGTYPTTATRRHGGRRLPRGAAAVVGPAGQRVRRIRGRGGIVIDAPHIYLGIGRVNDDELALLAILGAY
jgi:hypothetical protein